MHLRDLFPSDLETCRHWQMHVHISPADYTNETTIDRLAAVFNFAKVNNIQENISTHTNNCNKISVRLCPYALGWQCQNDFRTVTNWGDYIGFLINLFTLFDAPIGGITLSLGPTWRCYDEEMRVFKLGPGLELTETFYHLEEPAC